MQLLVSGLTTGATYTSYFVLKNSAAIANPQTYLNVQEGGTPYAEIARTLVQPGATWQTYSVTYTVPATFTSVYIEIGTCTTTGGVACQQGTLGASTIEAWVSGTVPGTVPGPYVPTTTTAATTAVLDNIVAAGDLATALASSNAAVAITTQGAGNGIAGTMLDASGTVLLGKNATDHVTTAFTATLASKVAGQFFCCWAGLFRVERQWWFNQPQWHAG